MLMSSTHQPVFEIASSVTYSNRSSMGAPANGERSIVSCTQPSELPV